jgi:hypothetical protein
MSTEVHSPQFRHHLPRDPKQLRSRIEATFYGEKPVAEQKFWP